MGTCLLLCEVSQKSIRGILRYIGSSKKWLQIMYELRTGLYAHKFATFWMLPKRFYHTFVFQITLNALYNQLKANRLARFRKT